MTKPIQHWSPWSFNPFEAMKWAAEDNGTPEDYLKVLEVLNDSTMWTELHPDYYLDELLQEIAGVTNIVCQCDNTPQGHKYRAVYDKGEECDYQ